MGKIQQLLKSIERLIDFNGNYWNIVPNKPNIVYGGVRKAYMHTYALTCKSLTCSHTKACMHFCTHIWQIYTWMFFGRETLSLYQTEEFFVMLVIIVPSRNIAVHYVPFFSHCLVTRTSQMLKELLLSEKNDTVFFTWLLAIIMAKLLLQNV